MLQPTSKSSVTHNGHHVAVFPVLNATSAAVINELESEIALGNENVSRLRDKKSRPRAHSS